MDSPFRSPAFKFDDIPGELPQATVPKDVDLQAIAQLALEKLNSLQRDDLTTDAIWRDLLALTDNFRTIYSRDKVLSSLQKRYALKKCSSFQRASSDPRVSSLGCVDVDVCFSTQHGHLVGSGAGTVSVLLAPDSQWRIWMLRTWLECFEGHGHPDEPVSRTVDGTNGHLTNGINDIVDGNDTYGAIVVGGGQAGLATAGRLQAIGVKYVLLERTAQIGDVWKNRYDSLRFHTTKDYGVLPFEWRFPEEDDKMLPASRIGAGHQSWSKQFGINIHTDSDVTSARYDNVSQTWTVVASSKAGDVTYKTRNLVLCIGPCLGILNTPDWASPERVRNSEFTGDVIHGLRWKSAARWAGKRGIVVGVANTGHDVAEDMANASMDVTMVQRGPTFILPVEWLHAAEDIDYHPGKKTSVADRQTITLPNKITRESVNGAVHRLTDLNAERFDALEKAGFKLQRHGDLLSCLFDRIGGHYIDIGASARIANGEIKVTGKPIKGLTPHGLAFEDDTEILAEVVVVATGFSHDFRADAARIIGAEAAEQMDDYGGLDAEGEMRGQGRLSGHPGLYYHGFDVRTARFQSRFIALSVQADVLGESLEPYRD